MSLAHVIDIPTNGHAVAVRSEHQAPLPIAYQTEAAQVMQMIERLTMDKTAPIERAEKAYALYQLVKADAAKREFSENLTACQIEMEPIVRDASNSHTKSKYATYTAVDRALRPIYTKYGFNVSFNTRDGTAGEQLTVICKLRHNNGQESLHEAPIPCDGKGANGKDVMTKTHAMGSALSYGKRYTIGLAFNITFEDDDDGNGASRKLAPAPERDMVPDVPLAQIDGDPPISAALVDELTGLIAKIKPKGATPALDVLLAHMEISSLSEIRARHFQTVKGKLVAKIAMQAANG